MHMVDLLSASQLLTDPYAVKILVATVRVAKCAQDISSQFGIPIAACYRRIRDLEAAGMLVCTERKLTKNGKRVNYYVSMVKSATVFYEEGKLKVKFQMKDGTLGSPNDGWHDIDVEHIEDDLPKGDDDDSLEDDPGDGR
jgi:hypothetical protein